LKIEWENVNSYPVLNACRVDNPKKIFFFCAILLFGLRLSAQKLSDTIIVKHFPSGAISQETYCRKGRKQMEYFYNDTGMVVKHIDYRPNGKRIGSQLINYGDSSVSQDFRIGGLVKEERIVDSLGNCTTKSLRLNGNPRRIWLMDTAGLVASDKDFDRHGVIKSENIGTKDGEIIKVYSHGVFLYANYFSLDDVLVKTVYADGRVGLPKKKE
jgi:hypothetical protein